MALLWLIVPDCKRPLFGDAAEKPFVEEMGKAGPDHVAIAKKLCQEWRDLLKIARAAKIYQQKMGHIWYKLAYAQIDFISLFIFLIVTSMTPVAFDICLCVL